MATDNGTAAAQAKGEAAAQSAPTVTQAEQRKEASQAASVGAGVAAVSEGAVEGVEAVGNATVEAVSSPEVAPVDTENAEGGQSFDYGNPPEDASDEEKAAYKVRVHDESLRLENPNGVVVREAGTSGPVGGESFDYGKPLTKD